MEREFEKDIYFCFIDYAKAFVWITANWKILRDGNTRQTNLPSEKSVCRPVRIRHGTMD